MADMSTEFAIYDEGSVYAAVCTSLPDVAVLDRMNAERPTTPGATWIVAPKRFGGDGSANPSPCDELPATHRHLYLKRTDRD